MRIQNRTLVIAGCLALLLAGEACAETRRYAVSGTLQLKTGTEVMGLSGGQMLVEVWSDGPLAPWYRAEVDGTLTARYEPTLARLTLAGTGVDGAYDDVDPGDVVVVNKATLLDEIDLTSLNWVLDADRSFNPVSFVVQMKDASAFPSGSDAQPLFDSGDVNEVFVTFAAKDGASTGLYQLNSAAASATVVPEPSGLGVMTVLLGSVMLSGRRKTR